MRPFYAGKNKIVEEIETLLFPSIEDIKTRLVTSTPFTLIVRFRQLSAIFYLRLVKEAQRTITEMIKRI
jgi:hypothetical protein